MKSHPNFIAIFILTVASSASAGSATWAIAPTTRDWFTASNWTPATGA
jgi:hypothetical protein